ncbi:MAG TPA: ATP-binding protein [Alphaproteobacteria bacterium]
MSQSFLKIRWPFIIFAVAVLLATQIMVTVNYFYHSRLQQAESAVDRTERALFLQHDFSRVFQRVFLAQRSFIITGEDVFQERYNRLQPQAAQKLEEVIASSRITGKKAITNLRQQYSSLIDFMDESVRRRIEYGDKMPVLDSRAKESFRLASRFDSTLSHYIDHERKYLNSFKNLQQERQLAYNQGILAAAILSSFFLGALGYLLLKQQQKENETQANLKDTKERLDLAITGSNDGVWDWDIATNNLFLSSRWKEIVGYTNDEMPNAMKAFDLLIHPDDRDRVWKTSDDYINKKTDSYGSTFRMRHKDGSWRWIMSRGQALWHDDETKAYRMIGVHTDVTSMKQMEEKLNIARETAEEANQAKTDFLSHISHEIRTPLNAIIGISRLLTQAQPLTESYREHINVLHTGSKNLQFLINDLLDLSKLDQGSLVLEKRNFKLRDMVSENIDLYRYHAGEKSISLHFESNIPADAVYYGDSLRISQVINNLLANAVKFTDAGSIQITLNRSEKTNKNNTDMISLIVEDTGIGIPHSQLKNIFHKFTQSDHSISRRYGGTGLGLSICKELCDLMDATIDVHSMEGQGSEFTVTIPLQHADKSALDETENEHNNAQPDRPHNNRPRILLVEDYQPNIFVAEALLESIGYDCDSVENGEEALRLLTSPRRQVYMAALLDLQLPDMSGYMIAEETRTYEAQNGLPPLPLIAMTAHTSKSHQDRCIISGMNDYMMKPIDLSALEKMLSLYATQEQYKTARHLKVVAS